MKYLLILLSFSTFGFASSDIAIITNQFDDKLIFEGKEYHISEYLMEHFFVKYPEKLPQLEIESTGLERGYVATFEVIDEELFVTDVEIQVRTKENKKSSTGYISVFDDIFPNKIRKKVNWKIGLLKVHYGGLSNTSLSGYYNNYLILEIKRGRVMEVRDYTKKELLSFKTRQFNQFKTTRQYRKLVKFFKKTRTRVYRKNQLEYVFKNDVIEFSKKFLVD